MRKYVIMGVQGSGKGTQATLLAADLDLVHISVGDIFRWNVQHHTKLGAQVRRTMAAGALVGDDLVEGVVKTRLARCGGRGDRHETCWRLSLTWGFSAGIGLGIICNGAGARNPVAGPAGRRHALTHATPA